jgi:hypothetical protein
MYFDSSAQDKTSAWHAAEESNQHSSGASLGISQPHVQQDSSCINSSVGVNKPRVEGF